MVVANFMSISSSLGQLYLHVGASSPNYKIIVRLVIMAINNQKKVGASIIRKEKCDRLIKE
jgi:hypothetical protein